MKDSRSLRWWGMITLFVIVAISYIDRINTSVLIIDRDFLSHIGLVSEDRARQGLLATAFMAGYGISSVVLTPFYAALLGVRRSLFIGLIIWGVVTFLSPMMNSYGMLLGSRVLLGVAEGPLFSLASAYIKAHFNDRENGRPNSLVNMGTGVGLMVGYPFVGYLLTAHDWQTSFHVLGLINIVLGIPLVLAFIHMPKTDTGMSKPNSVGSAVRQVGQIVRGALQTRCLLLVTVLNCAFLSYLWGISNWLPAYLKESRGFSLREMGWLASLPQYATVIGVIVAGFIIDRIQRRSVALMFLVGSVGIAVSIWLSMQMRDNYAAVYCLVAANFCWGLMSPPVPSTVQYLSRPEHVASTFGVVNGVGGFVAGFMPAIMGVVISAASHSSDGGFIAGFGTLIGAQAVIFICGCILWLRERGEAERIPGSA